MGRYILRYGTGSAAPADHVEHLLATPGVRVIDQSPRMLLVEGDESALQSRIKGLSGWSLHPEETTPLPDTRQKLR